MSNARKIALVGTAAALLAAPGAWASPTPTSPSGDAAASCSAVANQLVKRTEVWSSTPKDFRRFVAPVDPICHDFTGDGRRDVAFPILSGGTGGAFKFAVFRGSPEGSKKVTERGYGSKTSLRRKGRRLNVLNPVYRKGDGNCCPSGGFEVRTFRFTRTKIVFVERQRIKP